MENYLSAKKRGGPEITSNGKHEYSHASKDQMGIEQS